MYIDPFFLDFPWLMVFMSYQGWSTKHRKANHQQDHRLTTQWPRWVRQNGRATKISPWKNHKSSKNIWYCHFLPCLTIEIDRNRASKLDHFGWKPHALGPRRVNRSGDASKPPTRTRPAPPWWVRGFFLVVPMENTKVVSMAMGIAKIDGLFHGKFPSRNGWWLGVALFMETSIWHLKTRRGFSFRMRKLFQLAAAGRIWFQTQGVGMCVSKSGVDPARPPEPNH